MIHIKIFNNEVWIKKGTEYITKIKTFKDFEEAKVKFNIKLQ